MTTKSVIGRKYVADGTKAIDLNLRQEVELGATHKYTIIAEPYVCEYYRSPFSESGSLQMPPRKVQMMAVNVLDDRTGLTYAVEYRPANLVCDDRNQSGEPVDFTTRAKQIVEELNALFTGGGITDKCAVAFFTVSDCRDNKTSKGISFIGGNMRQIKQSIIAACSKSPEAFEIVRGAAIEASLRDVFDNQK